MSLIKDGMFKKRGTVFFPTANIQSLFDLLEKLFNLLDSSGIKWPIHLLSQTGRQAVLQAGICSEWMNQERQGFAFNARQPLLVGALLEKRHVVCSENISDIITPTEPRFVVCTREYDLISMYDTLPNACVVVSGKKLN
jgi:hypothetical protein